ncbi:MFS transporter [Planosporangium sp. 12N6]|uniref:MFS transporter n=1 Tax=Planosporangium spinosum TaxID=3402278 RepID=UPI003CE93BF5
MAAPATTIGVLRNRTFRLLWTGSTVSALGSWLLVVAAPYQVFRLTGSTPATGLALAVEAAPAMLVGPWAGVLVDRVDRRTTMIVADLFSAAGVALVLLGTTPSRLGFVYLGLLAENLAVVFFRPAAQAAVPAVVSGGELVAANALTGFAGGAARLLGPPLGTVLLSAGGLGLVVGIDVASYLGSAAATAAVTLPRTRRPAAHPFAARDVVSQLRDGLRHLLTAPVLRGLLITGWAYLTANAALGALLVPFVVGRLARPGQDIGYLLAGLGVGYLAGSAVSRRLIDRFPIRSVVTATYAAVGACFVALFNAPTLLLATVAAAASGVPGAVALVATQHRIQADTPDHVRGRVGAVFYASDASATVAGALLAPALTAVMGLHLGLTVLTGAVVATAVAALVLVSPNRSQDVGS